MHKTMKHFILVIWSIAVFTSVPGQIPFDKGDYRTAYVPSALLVGTFFAVQNGNSSHQRDMIALTGMLTSTATFIVLEKIKKQRNIKKKEMVL